MSQITNKVAYQIQKILEENNCHIELGVSVFDGEFDQYVCENDNNECSDIFQGKNPVINRSAVMTFKRPDNWKTFKFDENGKLKRM